MVDWAGQLSETPFLSIVRQIFLESLTGTLVVARGDDIRGFFFEKGELRTARSCNPEHRIGVFLKTWGNISESQLEWALNLQRENGQPLHKILVEKGILTSSVLDSEAKRLMEMITHSTLGWVDGVFHFQPEPEALFEPGVTFSLSSAAVMIEGIRRIPESDMFLELLGNLSGYPVIQRNPSLLLAIPSDVAYILSRVDGRTSLGELLRLIPGPKTAAAKLVYSLLYSGLVKIEASRQESASRQTAAPTRMTQSAPEGTGEHRKLVLDTYRRIDWISHYDLLGVSQMATEDEIERAYQERSRLFQSTLGKDLIDCQHQLSVISNRLELAYSVLTNPTFRKAYDEKVKSGKEVMEQAVESKERPETAPEESLPSGEIRMLMAAQSYERAKQLIEEGDYSPAIQMLEQAVGFVPDHAEYRYLLGCAQLENRYWRDQGLENLKAAANLQPKRHDILAALAKALLDFRRFEEARTHAQKALALLPRSTEYRDLKATIDAAAEKARMSRK